jgi:hypothetical protein
MQLKQQDLWTSSFSEAPANRSQLPERDLAWMIRAATWHSTPLQWLASCAPVGLYSKTSLDSLVQMEDGTLGAFSQQWGNAGISAPGGFSMRNISEFHSGAVASSLSDILETGDLPPRYFLSATACKGILRRAEKRGKELPEALGRALESVAESKASPVEKA